MSAPQEHAARRYEWTAEHGARLKRLRQGHGFRQAELSALIGQQRTVLSNYENGLRTPSPTVLERLAVSLDVDIESLVGDAELLPRHAGWDALTEQLTGLIDERDMRRVKRFVDLTELFAQLSHGELAAARWRQLDASSQVIRAQLAAVPALRPSGDRTRFARSIGLTLADTVRASLHFGVAPLPPERAFAEFCGLRMFVASLRPGENVTVMGVAVRVEALGVAVLVNADQTQEQRLATLSRLLGTMLVTSKQMAVVHTDASARQDLITETVRAFADQLVLPEGAVEQHLNEARRIAGHSTLEATPGLERQLRNELAFSYRVPAQVASTRIVMASEPRPRTRVRRPVAANVTPDDLVPPSMSPHQVTLEDLPPVLVDLLLEEVSAERATADGVAHRTGIDPAEIESRLVNSSVDFDALDDAFIVA